MITRRECISKIIPYKDEIMSKYGVRSMHIFGSVARSENWPRWNTCLRIKSDIVLSAEGYLLWYYI